MLDYEYKRKTQPHLYKRSWLLTVVTGALSIAMILGIIAVWKYIGHDLFIVLTVIVPTSVCALVLLLATLNGRREVFKDAYETFLALLYWW